MSHQTCSDSSEIKVKKSHFSIITNALSYISYTDDSGVVRRFDPIARELYRVMIASGSLCTKSRDTLAFEVNCSTGQITKSKKALSCGVNEFGGIPLIEIEQVKRKEGGKPKHVCTVNNVEAEAAGFMKWIWDTKEKSGLNPCEQVFTNKKTMSQSDLARSYRDFGFYPPLLVATSPCDINKKEASFNKTNMNKSNASACSHVDNSPFASPPSLREASYQHAKQALIDAFSVKKEHSLLSSLPQDQLIHSYLRKFDIPEKTLRAWIVQHGAEKVEFCMQRLVSEGKKHRIDNQGAYVQALLKSKAYEEHMEVMRNTAFVRYLHSNGCLLHLTLGKTVVYIGRKGSASIKLDMEFNEFKQRILNAE